MVNTGCCFQSADGRLNISLQLVKVCRDLLRACRMTSDSSVTLQCVNSGPEAEL